MRQPCRLCCCTLLSVQAPQRAPAHSELERERLGVVRAGMEVFTQGFRGLLGPRSRRRSVSERRILFACTDIVRFGQDSGTGELRWKHSACTKSLKGFPGRNLTGGVSAGGHGSTGHRSCGSEVLRSVYQPRTTNLARVPPGIPTPSAPGDDQLWASAPKVGFSGVRVGVTLGGCLLAVLAATVAACSLGHTPPLGPRHNPPLLHPPPHHPPSTQQLYPKCLQV